MSWDNIHLCEKCGEYTTSRLCTSCAQQEMIDNDPNPPPVPTLWCELCGVPISGIPSGANFVDVCEGCGNDVRDSIGGEFLTRDSIHIHAYWWPE